MPTQSITPVIVTTDQQRGTLKVLCGWGPEMERQSPFRAYVRQMVLWDAATTVEEARKGPMAVLQLSGLARSFAKKIPIAILSNGESSDLDDGN